MARRSHSESMTEILCSKCYMIAPKEAHHIFPREYFGRQPNGPFLMLCRRCHIKLDKIVHFGGLTRQDCYDLTVEFLANEEE